MRPIELGDFGFLLEGLAWTLILSSSALLCGGVLAAFLVALKLLRARILDALVYSYVGLFQGTPLIGQLFFFYFGLSILGIDTNALFAAIVALSLHSAAFLSEIWRGAIQSISRQQWEAGESLGLSAFGTVIYIILPQALRAATPPTVGFLVTLIKDSSLASVLGFVELMRAAQIVNNATFRSFLIFGTVALIYFGVCFPITALSRRLERRFSY